MKRDIKYYHVITNGSKYRIGIGENLEEASKRENHVISSFDGLSYIWESHFLWVAKFKAWRLERKNRKRANRRKKEFENRQAILKREREEVWREA